MPAPKSPLALPTEARTLPEAAAPMRGACGLPLTPGSHPAHGRRGAAAVERHRPRVARPRQRCAEHRWHASAGTA